MIKSQVDPLVDVLLSKGKRKASYQDSSPSDKKRLREDSEPVEEDESGNGTRSCTR